MIKNLCSDHEKDGAVMIFNVPNDVYSSQRNYSNTFSNNNLFDNSLGIQEISLPENSLPDILLPLINLIICKLSKGHFHC